MRAFKPIWIAPACLAALLVSSLSAFAAEPPADVVRMPVEEIKPLLFKAIDAPDGRARGRLAGPLADAITARFKGTSPILVDVDTEKRYEQPGCRRLKITVWQEGVLLPGAAAPRRQTIEVGLNFCRDGLPPSSLK